MNAKSAGLSPLNSWAKRSFDIILALIALILLWWLILFAAILTRVTLKSEGGFFLQKRVGQYGALFYVIKIRTMRTSQEIVTTTTSADDPRITPLGRFFRRTKIDELPQLINILLGHMSFVGPRPDVPGYADRLVGAKREYLTIRPGLTGPASLKYRNEEKILAKVPNPEEYNCSIIFPDKVRINLEYIRNYSFIRDIVYIIKTVI